MKRIIYCQTVLFEDQIEELKTLSGKSSIKDALTDAVEFFIKEKKA